MLENLNCLICSYCSKGATKFPEFFTAYEKMYGHLEAFEYWTCPDCKSVQIAQIPSDMAPYYPTDYYSLKPASPRKIKPLSLKFKKLKYQLLSRLSVPARSPLGKALGMKEFYNWFGAAKVQPEHSILDFGCGSGHLLAELNESGFSQLTGYDPFLSQQTIESSSLNLIAGSLKNLDQTFDVVMSHHSFEHTTDPKKSFFELQSLLRPGGVLILRIPYLGQAWKTYGIDWVSFDAPRHLCHASQQGLMALAESYNLALESMQFDSFEFQFWGSEQYKKGIPLFAQNSYGVTPEKSIFTKQQIKSYQLQSLELNKNKLGDQVCYIFRKPLR